MSDIALDRGALISDPFTDWYRGRPFQIAFAASVIIHALLIALAPDLRSVQIEAPRVLNVEIVIPEDRQIAEPQRTPGPVPVPLPEVVRQPELRPPVPEARPVERQVMMPEPVVEPVVRPPEPEVAAPAQRAELSPAIQRDIPLPEPMTLPRPNPLPEQRLEFPVEPKPVPQVRPAVVPPPVVQVEPRPEPQLQPRDQARPQPLPQPIVEPASPEQPTPRIAPVVSQPRAVEPAVAPPPAQTPPSAPNVAVPVQPLPAAPVPPAPGPVAVEPLARELTATYSQQISTQIKRHQKYPVQAQRNGWEGTAEVLLKIAADGRVTSASIGKSTGRQVLDREALEMVRRASPLPQAPQQLRGRELSVTVPIVFRLQDS